MMWQQFLLWRNNFNGGGTILLWGGWRIVNKGWDNSIVNKGWDNSIVNKGWDNIINFDGVSMFIILV